MYFAYVSQQKRYIYIWRSRWRQKRNFFLGGYFYLKMISVANKWIGANQSMIKLQINIRQRKSDIMVHCTWWRHFFDVHSSTVTRLLFDVRHQSRIRIPINLNLILLPNYTIQCIFYWLLICIFRNLSLDKRRSRVGAHLAIECKQLITGNALQYGGMLTKWPDPRENLRTWWN